MLDNMYYITYIDIAMDDFHANAPEWLQVLWATTPFILSLALLLATLRIQRTRLTLEDHEYLRGLIRHELEQMRGEPQAPYYAGSPTKVDGAPSHSASKL